MSPQGASLSSEPLAAAGTPSPPPMAKDNFNADEETLMQKRTKASGRLVGATHLLNTAHVAVNY